MTSPEGPRKAGAHALAGSCTEVTRETIAGTCKA